MAANISYASLNILYAINMRLYRIAMCCVSMRSTDPEYAGNHTGIIDALALSETIIITVTMDIWTVILTYFYMALSDLTYVQTQ